MAARDRLGRLWAIASVVLLVVYPILVYLTLRYASPRYAALLLLVALGPGLFKRLRGADRKALRSLVIVPLVTLLLLVGGAVLNSSGFVLLVPVLINGALLVTFGVTLTQAQPMIERFARLQDPDLRPPEVLWCRLWTWIWCGFFTTNVVISALLAYRGSVLAWTTYNGLVSYLIAGTLFGVEYTIRKYRFGRLGVHWLDRSLGRIFSVFRKVR